MAALAYAGSRPAVGNHGKFAALVLAAWVVGVLLGEVGEVGAGLELLQDVLCLGLGGVVGLASAPALDGDQDVAGLDLLVSLVLRLSARCSRPGCRRR